MHSDHLHWLFIACLLFQLVEIQYTPSKLISVRLSNESFPVILRYGLVHSVVNNIIDVKFDNKKNRILDSHLNEMGRKLSPPMANIQPSLRVPI